MSKKRIICLCTTYFQLITAVQMRRTLFSEDEFTVVMTSDSNGGRAVSDRLRETGIFDEVYYVERTRVAMADFRSAGQKAERFLNYFVKGSYVSYLKKPYDLFLTYNLYWYSFMMFNALQQDNPAVKVAKYEEGILSYFVDDRRFEYKYFKRIAKIKKFLRQPVIFDRLRTFYCFYPEFYEGNLSTAKIPPMEHDDAWLRDTLCTLFDVDPDKLVYDRKFLYFASMLDSEVVAGESGEFDILKEIVDVVGADNIMVKLHPRENDPERYRDLGVAIDANSDIPFEVIRLVKDFSDKTFLTCLSSSTINLATILPKRSKTYLTYGLLPEKVREMDVIVNFIDIYKRTTGKIKEVTGTEDFIVLESRAQMKEELGKFI
ncbi:MAG: hypothetical protein IJ198_15315 [Lachnospiraceae bacterium]|nr:hypothetical protein [Lachnospiraceae bacterium]